MGRGADDPGTWPAVSASDFSANAIAFAAQGSAQDIVVEYDDPIKSYQAQIVQQEYNLATYNALLAWYEGNNGAARYLPGP